MKVLGIIAEYNPIHNGHAYLLRQAKKETGADFTVVIMSGNYTQRGECALCDMHLRASMALNIGADLVLELPVHYSTAGAGYFASAAVAALSRLNVVDYLAFGSESADLGLLKSIAGVLNHEPEEYKTVLNEGLKKGLSFPAARAVAADSCLNLDETSQNVFNNPNDTLAIEYLRALLARGEKNIEPVAIKRIGSAHLDEALEDTPSSLAIRNAIYEHKISSTARFMPGEAADILNIWNNHRLPIFTDDFTSKLNYSLLKEADGGYSRFFDISEDLSNRIRNSLRYLGSFSSIAEPIVNKSITKTHVMRALMHIMLGITDENTKEYIRNDYLEYVRLLGINKGCDELTGAIDEGSDIILLSKLSSARDCLGSLAMRMLKEELTADNIYNSVVTEKFGAELRSEFSEKIIVQ
ncbi:MAG: nucleotidyltransferase family protein [Lachnospiraceae bacterium]|nr:nucleotidyltransferase family protein [Lachnospiraceae bacterium]